MRRLFILLFLGIVCFAQTVRNLATIPDVTMTGSNVAVSGSSILARAVQFVCPSGNSAAIRIGDTNISGSRGAVCAAGGGQYWPEDGTVMDLATIYARGTSSDTLTVTYRPY